MARRHRSHHRRPMADINVVPYIDVMLVLLVIFMITAPLLKQGVVVDLPKAKAAALKSVKDIPLIVVVDKAGNYYLNASDKPGKAMTSRDLMNRVSAELTIAKQQHKTRQVLVRGDQGVAYGRVVHAMVLLQHAGAKQVGLMTDSADSFKVSSRVERS